MDIEYLKHHGIKGQKWGVRRGPPYPIEDKVLPKGTRLNSVSPIPNSELYKNRGRWFYTYNPNDKWDSKIYKGPFARYTMQRYQAMVFEHKYETVKDLKMPTSKERVDEFINLYTNNKKMVVKDLKDIRKLMISNGVAFENQNSRNINLKNLKTEDDYKAAYELFNHAMENYMRFASSKKYAELMSTKYDAMVDDNNQSVYNDAHDPVIIFNAQEALRTVGDASMITVNEVITNMNDVRNELAKKGRRMKL